MGTVGLAPEAHLDLRIGDIVFLEGTASASAECAGLALVIYLEESGQSVLVACMVPDDGKSSDSENTVQAGPDHLSEGTLHGEYLVRTDRLATTPRDRCRWSGHLAKNKLDQALRKTTALMVRSHYHAIHGKDAFSAGRSRIPVAGRVYDHKEMVNLVDAALDFWLTAGPYAERFERAFAGFVGTRHCSLTNSGSSANLLAFLALTSPYLGERRIRKGDEVITVAAAFPTTLAPIVQFGAVPVFVDIRLPAYNVDCGRLEQALSGKTRAVVLAHTLGNPFDVERVTAFCREHGLWLIEDCCDALGSTCAPSSTSGENREGERMVGTFGHLSTFSFYPAHHITMGEGGAVCTQDPELGRIVNSLRDWGRDCSCAPGEDDHCGRRFSRQMGELPYGYDHKYVYSHLGYNLKVTEMQAAVGLAQLEKARDFIDARKRNWRILREGLSDLEQILVLPEPAPRSDPSWFGFPITVREESGFSREKIVGYLESRGIQTRMLFSGNILRHPCFDELRSAPGSYRVVGPLSVSDLVTRATFWIGLYPALTPEMVAWIVEEIHHALGRSKKE